MTRYVFTLNGKIFFDDCKSKEEAYGELKIYLDEMYGAPDHWEDVFICKEESQWRDKNKSNEESKSEWDKILESIGIDPNKPLTLADQEEESK